MLHNLQIEKAVENIKDKLSSEALIIINNMRDLITELIKENEELEKIVNEDNDNMIGRI